VKIIIAGSRSINEVDFEDAVKKSQLLKSATTIISGTAKGADQLGEDWAKSQNLSIERYPADWEKYGKRAGYLRNCEMGQVSDGCLCIWDGKSPGTKLMMNIARENGLFLEIYYTDSKLLHRSQ